MILIPEIIIVCMNYIYGIIFLVNKDLRRKFNPNVRIFFNEMCSHKGRPEYYHLFRPEGKAYLQRISLMVNCGEDINIPGFQEFIYPAARFIKTVCAFLSVKFHHLYHLSYDFLLFTAYRKAILTEAR